MSRTTTTWRWILVTLSLSCLLAGIDLLLSCSSGVSAARAATTVIAPAASAAVPPPPPADTRDADAQLKAARQQMVDHDTAAATQHAEDAERIRGLKTERDQLADDAGRARLAWTAGMLIAAGIGFGILVFVLPLGRRWPLMASVGSFAGAALALIVRAIYGWLTWLGAALGGGFVLYAAWQIARHKRATAEAAAHGDRLEDTVKTWWPGEPAALADLLRSVKQTSADAQATAGVSHLVAAIRGKRPKPAAAAPPGGARA